MINKKKYWRICVIILILIIFLLNFNLITAADETTSTTTAGSTEELIDISNSLGLKEGSVFGQGIVVSSGNIATFFNEKSKLIINNGEDNQIILTNAAGVQLSKSLTEITFTGENGKISINGNKFENIVKNAQGTPAYIELNKITGGISEARFTSRGGEYIINGASFSADPNSLVSYNTARENLLVINNGKIKNIDKPITITGDNVEIYEGYKLFNGELSFDGKGNSFIKGSGSVDINGVESMTFSPEGILYIEFEKEVDSTRDSLIFTKENLKVSSNGDEDSCGILFNEKNPYVKIEEGDAFNIFPDKNSKIEVNTRTGTELIPKINIIQGNADITEDGKTISFENGMYSMSKNNYPADSTTSPVEILYKSNEEGFAGSKLIVDNFNRMAMIPENEEEYFADYEGLEVKFSAKVKHNYLNEENIETLLGTQVRFDRESTEGIRQMTLGRLRDYWNVLTPETQASIKEIEISTEQVSSVGEIALAYASSGMNKIVFRESSDSFDLSTFRHEAAHLRTYKLYEEVIKDPTYISLKKQREDLAKEFIEMRESKPLSYSQTREYNSLVKDYNSLTLQIIEIEEGSNIDFVKEWKSVAGEYDNFAKTKEGYTIYSNEFKEFNSREPAGGYMLAYGATNFYEDVATFNEKISEPEYFVFLLSEENPHHDIYAKKLSLLNKYKFISQEEYQAILNAAKEYKYDKLNMNGTLN